MAYKSELLIPVLALPSLTTPAAQAGSRTQDRLILEKILQTGLVHYQGLDLGPVTVSGTGGSYEDLLAVAFGSNVLGSKGVLHVRAAGSVVGLNAAKNIRLSIKDGAGTYNTVHTISYGAGDSGGWYYDATIINNNSETSQLAGVIVGGTTNTFASSTLTVDTTATGTATKTAEALSIVIRGARNNAGDTVQADWLLVLRYPTI